MKKRLKNLAILVVFTLIAFTGCVGPDGATFLSYSWTSQPQYFYDENPSTPSTVYNGDYFTTDEGTYYMEYTAWDDSSWWMYYTIEAKEGDIFMMEGEDTYFEITLYSTGPTLYEWSEEYSTLVVPSESEQEVEKWIQKDEAGADLNRLPQEGHETITKNGYQLTIEYGRLEKE